MKYDIETVLLRLEDGLRVLRLSESQSGLCLEKRLDADASVARQTQRWKRVFTVVLERELGKAR